MVGHLFQNYDTIYVQFYNQVLHLLLYMGKVWKVQ